MKRLAAILFLLCADNALASFPMDRPFCATHNWSSYDSPQLSPGPSYVLGGSYFATGVYDENNQYTNLIYTLGEGGSSWAGDLTNNIEPFYQPLWASFPTNGYNLFQANNNGGFSDTNTIVTIGTNIANTPGLTFNRLSATPTNEFIPCQAIAHWFVGNSAEDGASASNRNNGSLMLDNILGTANFDLYNELYTNGNPVSYYVDGHPKADLSLVWAIWEALNAGLDTNVYSLALDWSAVTATTNHCTASGISVVNGTLTATVHLDRMAMGWDVPDGTITNDARNFSTLVPILGNAFRETLQVINLPAGNYTVAIDGSNVVTLSSADLAAGWNMFTNYNGAIWAQKKEVLGRKRDQMGCNRVTLLEHSAGQDVSLNAIAGKTDMANFGSKAATEYATNGKRGTNFLTAIKPWIDQVQTNYDAGIFTAAQQTNHTFTVTLITHRYAPYHK